MLPVCATLTAWRACPMRGKMCGFFFRHKKLALGAVVVIGIMKFVKYRKMQKLREEWAKAGKDVVVVHSIPPTKYCPDGSPFTLKLLTYLRMAEIEYKIDSHVPMGPRGKLPWITLNGEDYSDSQFIIQHLNLVFEKNFSYKLSSEQKAMARAFRIMTEEHLLWGLALWRFGEDKGKGFSAYIDMPWCAKVMAIPHICRTVKKAGYYQGCGRYSRNELHEVMIQNLAALSHFIGNKPFLMGDDPCEEDCAVFGLLAQLKWQSIGSPYTTAIKENFKNLNEYCVRMKERFWPDWNNCLMSPRN